MSPQQRRHNVVEVHASRAPEIGRTLWALQDARSRTLEELEGVTPAMVDWLPPDGESGIGTVLYHLAGIEADWLYVEVLEQPEFPPEVVALFSHDMRDTQGHAALFRLVHATEGCRWRMIAAGY